MSSQYQAMVGKGPSGTQQPYKPGAVRAGGNPPVTPITSTDEQQLHAADHRRMSYNAPISTQALERDEFERIDKNARGGCTHCTAFIAGAKRATEAAQVNAQLKAAKRAAQAKQPITTRTQRPSSYQVVEQARRSKADRAAALRIAGQRAADVVSPAEGEPINEFIARREAARGAAELQWRGVPYSTAAPVPSLDKVYSLKDSGQIHIGESGNTANNGSTSPVMTVQPQSVGKRVLYNTTDAAALDAGVPNAASPSPTSTADISLDPGAFHVGGHQAPYYKSREGATGISPAPIVNVPPTPVPTAMMPAAPTVANSGSPTASFGQVNFAERARLERAAERSAMQAAGERAVAEMRRYENEQVDAWVARVARARGAAELAAQGAFRRSQGKS